MSVPIITYKALISMRIFSCACSVSSVLLSLVLGGCAYSTKASFQDITFLSPDAHDAKCLVYVDKIKYQVWPPQTVNIKKSEKPMLVVCSAPGNREVEIEVPPKIEEVAIWGTPVGMAWDYASKSLFSYPEVIAIDFSQEELKSFPLPKHNNPDIRQPEDYNLEEFLPGEPSLNKDKDKKAVELPRRGEGEVEAEAEGDALEVGASMDNSEVVENKDDESLGALDVTVEKEAKVEAADVIAVPAASDDTSLVDNNSSSETSEASASPVTEQNEGVKADSGPVSLVPEE